VRIALGATRARLVRLALTESLLLATLGVGLGLVFAFGGIKVLQVITPTTAARKAALALDGTALLFAVGAGLLTALLAGLPPALAAARTSLAGIIRSDARGAVGSRSRHVMLRSLIIAQIAVAFVLANGAALFSTSYFKIIEQNKLLATDYVLTAQLNLRGDTYKENEARVRFWTTLSERLGSLPGVTAVGLTTTRTFAPEVAAVVQGHSPDTGWSDLAEAALAIRNGAFWVACNIDATLPTERGLMPGNGSMVAALRTATDVEPVVAGKPARPLMDQAIRSAGASKPLVVGDRLDTDIAGASAAELDALLVLTGVATPAQVLQAPAELRPRYLSADLSGLLLPLSEVEIGKQPGWDVEVGDGALTVTGSGDPLALLRGLCATWWPAGGGPVTVRAGDDASMAALGALNIG